MNLRNKATLLLLDQIDTVQVVFTPYIEGLTKTYTYKAKKGIYKPGDLAVVIDSNNHHTIVKVHAIDKHATIDPYATFSYKWLVSKVDPAIYHASLKVENKLMDLLINADRFALVQSVKAEMLNALPDTDTQAILAAAVIETELNAE